MLFPARFRLLESFVFCRQCNHNLFETGKYNAETHKALSVQKRYLYFQNTVIYIKNRPNYVLHNLACDFSVELM